MVIYETNCHWEDCAKEYDTQEQLVHVSPERLRLASRSFQVLCSENGLPEVPGPPPGQVGGMITYQSLTYV